MTKTLKKPNYKKKDNAVLQLRASMKWGDFLIILIVVIISFGLWGKLWITPKGGELVSVIAQEQILLQYDLHSGLKVFENKKIFEIIQEYNEDISEDETLINITSNSISFVIQLKDEKVRFKESNCPNRVCVNTGFISKNAQIAACAPAGIIIKITGAEVSDDPDMIIG